MTTHPGWRFLAVAGLGLADAAWLWWASSGTAAQQLVAVLGAAVAGCLALLWISADRRFEHLPLVWVLSLALLLRVVAAQATPLLEDDHYRYLWDGFRTAIALDPYRLAPSAYFGAAHLAPQWQDILSGINNPDIPSLYGPALQWLFALAHVIAPGRVGGIQALVLIADLACLLLLAQQRVGRRWLLAYALHPMILNEAMASAHPDSLVALWLLMAMVARQRGRALRVGVLLALAVATKAGALVVLPLFVLWPRQRSALLMGLGFVVTVVALYLPFIAAGGSDGPALLTFGVQWRFNPLLFRLFEAALPANFARAGAGAVVIVGVMALAWRRRWSQTTPPPVDLVLLLLLLLAPAVNPWYWLWALGPAMLARRLAVAAVSAVGALAHINSTVLHEAGWAVAQAVAPFSVGWPLAVAQLVVVGLAWACDERRRRSARVQTP